jgi:drug/metabolite transporter (DMT)-like permease
MGALLGLAAALAYGVSDFVAGVASRRHHFMWVSLLGFVAALVVSGAAVVAQDVRPETGALLWGALSGVGSGIGTLGLFRGYGRGEMAVAGPLSAVGAAAFPTMVGAALGERLPALGVAGVLLAFPAIWMMSRAPQEQGVPRGVARTGTVDGLISGAGFGLLFVALGQAGDGSGLWPVLAGEVVAVVLLGAVTAVRRPPWDVDRRWLGIIVAAGLLSIVANILFFLATHRSLLTVAAVLTSLYPGVTVAMGAMLLDERPDRLQKAGLVLGAVAVTAIVVA